MNPYMWPNERFMYKPKPPTMKAVNKDNDDVRFQQILKKLNCLETPVKLTRVVPHSENQPDEASYIVNKGRNPYSNI